MKTSKKVWLELKKLGLMPEKMGDNIKFTYQMVDCIYIQDKEDEEFFSLYVPSCFCRRMRLWRICSTGL